MSCGKMTIIHDAARGTRRPADPFLMLAKILLATTLIVALPAAGQSATHAESAVSVLCYHSFIEKKKRTPTASPLTS